MEIVNPAAELRVNIRVIAIVFPGHDPEKVRQGAETYIKGKLGQEMIGDFRWLLLLVGDEIVRMRCNVEASCLHKPAIWWLEYEA